MTTTKPFNVSLLLRTFLTLTLVLNLLTNTKCNLPAQGRVLSLALGGILFWLFDFYKSVVCSTFLGLVARMILIAVAIPPIKYSIMVSLGGATALHQLVLYRGSGIV